MYQVSCLRKVRSAYNKFVATTKRTSTSIKIEHSEGKLIHTIPFGLSAMKITLESDNGEDFAPISVSYDDWYACFDQFKGIKETEISVSNDELIIGTTSIPLEKANSNKFEWIPMMDVTTEALNYAILIGSVCAKNGKLPCNNNTFFCLKDEVLNIINTNDIILQYSKISDVEAEDTLFVLQNKYISTLKKWLACGADSDDINLSYCTCGAMKFINFNCTCDGLYYELICPIEMNSDYERTYNVLFKLINSKYMGRPVELDEQDMYEKMVEEAANYLLVNGKKGVTKKSIKKVLDNYMKESDKVAAFKMIDSKIFDVTYLNLSNSVGEENLYILRTLYSDYTAATSEFDSMVYYLNTTAQALLFGHQGDIFEYKTLFMLRKPKEAIVTDVPDEFEDEELENKMSDEDVFEPT